MTYKELHKLLKHELSTPSPEAALVVLIHREAAEKALQAVNDCLELGLDGKGD
ncbi:MAG: hypothetical protein Q7T57_02735 [Dehalococcoidales bacterium]|nr:hypothetical protein [Dehalococcoidales bacterium]